MATEAGLIGINLIAIRAGKLRLFVVLFVRLYVFFEDSVGDEALLANVALVLLPRQIRVFHFEVLLVLPLHLERFPAMLALVRKVDVMFALVRVERVLSSVQVPANVAWETFAQLLVRFHVTLHVRLRERFAANFALHRVPIVRFVLHKVLLLRKHFITSQAL